MNSCTSFVLQVISCNIFYQFIQLAMNIFAAIANDAVKNKYMYCKYLLIVFLLCSLNIAAQQLHLQSIPQDKTTPHLNLVFNRILNGNLQHFYKKLASVKKTGKGVVNIVHIGDSHIQPDYLSAVVRNNLQSFFGNAGRGLVFPYQLAKSNAPGDIVSSSNIAWEFNRLAHPEIPIECGIAGHAIKSNRALARINFSLKDNANGPQNFSTLKFFIENAVSTSWMFESDSGMMPVMLNNKNGDSIPYETVALNKPVSSFTLTSHSAGEYQSFYGVSLESDKPGVRLHTIGVNGARYDHYNAQPLFWQQLPALNADLVIISLGTNEAQASSFDAIAFSNQLDIFLERIKNIFPDVAILITTPQDSYKGKGSNAVMRTLNYTLSGYCQQNNIALWDLYKITSGFGAARTWLKKGYMNSDRVHFTSAAYNLQGKLLYNALAQGYNDFIKNNQNFR